GDPLAKDRKGHSLEEDSPDRSDRCTPPLRFGCRDGRCPWPSRWPCSLPRRRTAQRTTRVSARPHSFEMQSSSSLSTPGTASRSTDWTTGALSIAFGDNHTSADSPSHRTKGPWCWLVTTVASPLGTYRQARSYGPSLPRKKDRATFTTSVAHTTGTRLS